jgi:hypothetical protein
MENYYHGANVNDLKALKQEFAGLREYDAKYDKAYYCIAAGLLAGNLYVQSVYDKVYIYVSAKIRC